MIQVLTVALQDDGQATVTGNLPPATAIQILVGFIQQQSQPPVKTSEEAPE